MKKIIIYDQWRVELGRKHQPADIKIKLKLSLISRFAFLLLYFFDERQEVEGKGKNGERNIVISVMKIIEHLSIESKAF